MAGCTEALHILSNLSSTDGALEDLCPALAVLQQIPAAADDLDVALAVLRNAPSRRFAHRSSELTKHMRSKIRLRVREPRLISSVVFRD